MYAPALALNSLSLSKRQQEILRAACIGTPDKVMADQLGVSPRTLEGHWRAIHQKLGTVNRCQAGYPRKSSSITDKPGWTRIPKTCSKTAVHPQGISPA
jgi:DNA-binding CsgD family transcriptional regulator